MLTRAGVLAAVIVAVGVYGSRVAGSERSVAREPLAALPIDVGAWHAAGDMPIDDESLGVLGVDDYLNRLYARPSVAPVSLYIGYYASQRQGDTIHSPQNCLPGAGWQAVESGRATLDAGGRSLVVNRYMIQKGLNRQVVLYWYQGRGRVVANEYTEQALADGRCRAAASHEWFARQGRSAGGGQYRRCPGRRRVSRRFRSFPLSLTFQLPAMKRFLLCVLMATMAVAGCSRDPKVKATRYRRRGRCLRRATQVQGSHSRISQRARRAAVARRRPLQTRSGVHGNRRPRQGVRILLTGGGPRSVESRRAVAVGRVAAHGWPV